MLSRIALRSPAITLGSTCDRIGLFNSLREYLSCLAPSDDQPSTSYASFSGMGISGQYFAQRWATKKAGGSAKQKQKSAPKNLGIKMHQGELIFPGTIIARQRGTKYRPGDNVGIGKDHTLFATSVGFVNITTEQISKSGHVKEHKFIHVRPISSEYSPEECKALEQQMIQRRAAIKRQMLKSWVTEPALYYTPMRQQPAVWAVAGKAAAASSKPAGSQGQTAAQTAASA